MSTQIFISLPVQDLQRSIDFFSALGYSFDPQFSDENAKCLVIDADHIYVMLLTHEPFKKFTKKAIADATTSTEVTLSLIVDSREAVDELVEKALASGGSSSNETDDEDYMYLRSFQDPDGHLWEVLYLDMSALSQ